MSWVELDQVAPNGNGTSELEQPPRRQREREDFGELHPDDGALRLGDQQRRREDLRRGEQRSERRAGRESHDDRAARPRAAPRPGSRAPAPQRDDDREDVAREEHQRVDERRARGAACAGERAGRIRAHSVHGSSVTPGRSSGRRPPRRRRRRRRRSRRRRTAAPRDAPSAAAAGSCRRPRRPSAGPERAASPAGNGSGREERPHRVEDARVRVGRERPAARDVGDQTGTGPAAQASWTAFSIGRL